MDKQARIHRLNVMSLAFSAVFTLMAVGLVSFRIDQIHEQKLQKAVQTATGMIERKNTQIAGLVQQVEREKQVDEVSRGIGLMKFSPGPWIDFYVTWYAEGGINGDGITAVGRRVNQDWTVAVDPRVIPLGSIVQVKFADGTTKVYQALDTGGAIKGNRMDIYDPSIYRCFKNGVQKVQVRILVRGNWKG